MSTAATTPASERDRNGEGLTMPVESVALLGKGTATKTEVVRRGDGRVEAGITTSTVSPAAMALVKSREFS